jgi:alpha-L-fucosidase
MNDWTYVSPEYTNDWLARTTEIVQKYQPEVMYFDWWIGQPNFRPNATKFAAFYYDYPAKHGIAGVINIKDKAIDWMPGRATLSAVSKRALRPTTGYASF